MSGGDVILVAGNPAAYPVEYYDPETETYQGVIPRLLEEFAAQAGCEVRYYAAGIEDRRLELAEQTQVDIVFGCVPSDAVSALSARQMVVLETEQEGLAVSYSLLLTEAMPESLGSQLRRFLAETTQAERAGLLVESAQVQPAVYHVRLQHRFYGAAALALALAVTAAVLGIRLRRRHRELQESRERDAVTGAANREALGHWFHRFVRDRSRVLFALFYFHLDLPEAGREEGDALLCQGAEVLRDCARDTDMLARTGESDFAVLRLSPGEQETEEWAGHALELLRGVCPHAWAGVCRLQGGDTDLDQILERAAYTARTAGRTGLPVLLCGERVLETFLEERALRHQLRGGFENGEFKLYIQYYVDPRTGRYAGGKALSRWEHPDRGLLLPGQFLPCMEKEGVISRLDLYIVEQACVFLEDWSQAGRGPFFLCCSLALETVLAEDLAERCRELLEQFRFPRRRLVLELPEEAWHAPQMAEGQLTALRDLGVRLACGGFGRDVASLLTGQLPDILTLERTLVDALGREKGGAALEEMVRLGHKLGCEVFAVGAERAEQLTALRVLGCDMALGYSLHTPIPAWQSYAELCQ